MKHLILINLWHILHEVCLFFNSNAVLDTHWSWKLCPWTSFKWCTKNYGSVNSAKEALLPERRRINTDPKFEFVGANKHHRIKVTLIAYSRILNRVWYKVQMPILPGSANILKMRKTCSISEWENLRILP